MQIFEINKKNTDVLVFSGITIISKEKALRSRVVKETTFFFINNGDVGTNTPLQKHHFRLRQSGRIVILKKKQKPKQQDTLLGIIHNKREVDNVPVLCNAS